MEGCFNGYAQSSNWAPANNPLFCSETRAFYIDTLLNEMYIVGHITYTDTSFQQQYICKYSSTGWDTIGNFNIAALSLIMFNGDIIIGGFFTSVNGQQMSIARYDGTSWHSMGFVNGGIISNFKLINNELYVMGVFTQIDTVNCCSIAKWNGTQWMPVNNFNSPGFAGIYDACEYNGELYVGGNFYNAGVFTDIAVFRNGIWQNVGQGFFGGLNGLSALTVYKGELYAAGAILKNAGNVGNGIQKWNGNIWSEVGTGLQDINNSFNNYIQVYKMGEYKGDLYVAGDFFYAGNIPAFCAARWDGIKWCSLGTNQLTDPMLAFGFYKDTLFLSYGGDSLNNQWTNHLIKCTMGIYIDSCTTVGIDEISNKANSFTFYPNPMHDNITINYVLLNKSVTLQIFNMLGENVAMFKLEKNSTSTNIDIANLPSGVYSVRLGNEKGWLVKRLVKE